MKGVLLPVAAGLLVLFTGCKHVVRTDVTPAIAPPAAYSIATLPSSTATGAWWREFNDPYLTAYIQKALTNNFTIRQGIARVRQALAQARAGGARLKPELDGALSADTSRFADGDHSESYRLSLNLSWEIDLWDRLSSAARADALEYEARRDALQDLAFLVASQVATAYFGIIEDTLTLALLDRQIKTNETVLGLIRLRVGNGLASLVDIYQQKHQLAALTAQAPIVKARRTENINRLAALTGAPPVSLMPEVSSDLPSPASLPAAGIPAALLERRFDLRQLQQELLAADQRVAVAVAERLPGIRIGGSMGLKGAALAGDNLFLSLFGEALAPLLDWGRRREEVERTTAVVDEKIAAYADRFLTAMAEVENSMHTEERLREYSQALAMQEKIAGDTFREAKNRYLQGATDYLPVITALQSTQRLEQDMLQARGRLAINRIRLYRALGGPAPLSSADRPSIQ